MSRSINILIIEINFHHPQQRNVFKNVLIVIVLSLLDSDNHCLKIVEITQHQPDSFTQKWLTFVPNIEQWSVLLFQRHHFENHLLQFG